MKWNSFWGNARMRAVPLGPSVESPAWQRKVQGVPKLERCPHAGCAAGTAGPRNVRGLCQKTGESPTRGLRNWAF
eukprot:9470652-Pyramimonas_sp.AAC.1